MNGKPEPPPAREPRRQPDEAIARRERLAAALRDNLQRRKAQARGRTEAAEDEPSG